MGSPRFDLRSRPWLPVRVGSGTSYVGLRHLFVHSHEIEDLAVPVPPAAAGLWRILYALTARITGLDDPTLSANQWMRRRHQVAMRGHLDEAAVHAYLDRWADRFDLFHPEWPWLQDPRLREECSKSAGVNKLLFDRPSGQNHVWFAHFVDGDPTPVPAAEAAWHLVAQLYYGAAGRCSTRTVGSTSAADTTAGPLRAAVSYHPIGRSVFESLLAGLPAPTGERGSGAYQDRCPWELNELPDPLSPQPAATWPGGLLTGRARHAVLLVPDTDGEQVINAYLTWAWRVRPQSVGDPYLIMLRSKEGSWYHQRADSSRALWRDIDALLRYRSPNKQRPSVLGSCGEGLPFADEVRIRAYGFDQDGQAKDNQWYTAVTPPILRWLEERDSGVAQSISSLREAAERVGARLSVVLSRASLEALRLKDGPWSRRAATFYWRRAEETFWRLLEAQNFEQPFRPFLHIAFDAIEYAVGEQDRLPRVAKAVHEARRMLVEADRVKESA